MIIVKPVPPDAFTSVHDNDGNTGWLHDCGAFAYSPNQPRRCGVCWSAGRTSWAHNGSWQRAYVIRQTSEVA
ncbi:hypothetical protein [Kribbella pratensis]|uniref:Uncharacterized protein n=1 Tax=Kribbella pratensis TaxID=2512112 RepID=A0A4V6Q9C4_9ACTN|nr:hypothetical protein [Kribbella pratensis]TDW70597.1 hypothetical protein EV653_4651 [Kribbella pratensis]